MLRVLALSAGLLLCVGQAHSIEYVDAVGDAYGGNAALDLTGANLWLEGGDLVIDIKLSGSPLASNIGKYTMGIQGQSGNSLTINPWERPITMAGGMKYWIGAWMDGGTGFQLWEFNGTSWEILQTGVPTVTSAGLTIRVPAISVGAAPGRQVKFDIFSTIGGVGSIDGAADALSTNSPTITTWTQSFNSTPLNVLFPMPAPTLLSPGTGFAPGPVLADLNPAFAWSPVEGATGYGLYIRDVAADVLVFDHDYLSPEFTTVQLGAGVLQPGKAYRWNMRTRNDAGWGDFSSRLYFRTATTTFNSPGPLEVQYFSDHTEMGFTDNTADEDGFKVERSTNGTTWSVVHTLGPVSGSGNSVFWTDNNVEPRTTYYYRVRAYKGSTYSGYSNVTFLTTPAGPPGPFTLSATASWDAAIPGPKVSLTWTPSPDAGGYIVYRNSTILPGSGGAQSPYTDSTGLVPGSTYTWVVRASNADGTRDSNTVTLTMPTAPVPGFRLDQVANQPVYGSSSATDVVLEGAGFQSGCVVRLYDLTNAPHGPFDKTPVSFSPTSLTIRPILGATASTWSAQVINPGDVRSQVIEFQVNSAQENPAVSYVRAAQRAGTKLVDIYYNLSGVVGTTVVTVEGSSNGGASYTLPLGNVVGDTGSGVAPGSNKRIVWDAGAGWPDNFSTNVRFRVTAAGVAGTSASMTVDTRSTTPQTTMLVDVTGRVLNGGTSTALSGASVSLAGRSTTTLADGTFILFGLDLNLGTTLTATATGFLGQTRTISAEPGQKAVNAGDVMLAPNTSKPVVEWVRMENPKGVYLRNLPTALRSKVSEPEARARVNWNGNTPGTVEFWANSTLIGTRTGQGPEYTITVPVDTYFPQSITTHQVKVVARAAGGVPASFAVAKDVHVVTPHNMILGLLGSANVWPGSLAIDFEFPLKSQSITLPRFGKYGCDMALGGSFDYTYDDGSWEATFGVSDTATQGKRGRRPLIPGLTRYPTPKLYIGDKEIEAGIYGTLKGSSLHDPFVIDQAGFDVSLGWKGELTRYTIADLALPGIGTLLGKVPGSGDLMNNFSVIFWGKVNGDGSILFKPSPLDFDEVTLDTTLGVEASYEPSPTAKIHAKIYGGGEGYLNLGNPAPLIREAGCRVYFGLEAEAWMFSAKREWVIVEHAWLPARRLSLQTMNDTASGYLVEAAGNHTAGWKPMARLWRDKGGEAFLFSAGPARRMDESAATALNAYAGMETTPSPGAVYLPAAGPGRRIASEPSLPTQAELPLLQNVFPNSEPALAARGTNQMLLYVRDTGAENPVHFTEVAWTHFNGTSWSAPAAIESDTRGQFAPQVAFDGNGAAVAVWERMKDASFSDSDLELAAAEMEIVSATWDSSSGLWGMVTGLTDNTHLDHSAQLAGPLADGDLILIWRENATNLLIGTASGPTRLLTRRWDSATSTWGDATTLVENLSAELSVSISAAGSKAILLLARDMDGDFATASDTELFHRIWDEAAGTWSDLVRYTDDPLSDRNAKVVVDSAGSIYVLWQRGTELVMDRDLAGTPSIVRTDSATAGFADFSLAISPGGNVVALWQEMTDFGSDVHFRVLDPASNTWGLDSILSHDSDLERSFSTAWDNMGNLVLAYNNVKIEKVVKAVAVEGGGSVQVAGVPQPGQVDLFLSKRAVVRDLSIPANGLTAAGTNFLPGDPVTFKAKVRNNGNVAVENVPVAFYDGDPADGGTLIQTVVLSGWLKAADEVEASIDWTVPTPAIARTIFVMVDPLANVTESSETNNTLALPINGVNLELAYGSGVVLADGSVSVTAKVSNRSAPASPVSTLRLKLQEGETTLAETQVSELQPGESVDVPLLLPPGSHPEGVRSYRMTVDEETVSGDVDVTDNEVLFSLNLWVDEDGDGIPREWEIANGTNDLNPDDATVDPDGDGFTNKQEYLAGTDPRSFLSALKIGELARQATPDGLRTQVSWASVEGRVYRLERSYDLGGWHVLQDNVAATPPLNTIIDEETPPGGKAFYRVALPTP